MRFQRLPGPIAPGSLKPHDPDVKWENTFAGWAPGQHQYYWRDWDLDIVAVDTQYNEKRGAMAFEVAANGGIEARATLRRIFARDPDPDQRRKVAEALAALESETS